MNTYTRPFSPCSSPASSPVPLVDSSPASSSDTDFTLDLQDPPPLTLGDPLAASAKATRLPPEHEKKPVTPPCSLPCSLVDVPTKSKKRARHDDWQPDSTPCFSVTGVPPNPTYTRPNTIEVHTFEDLEDAIWDDASTQVVDNAHGTITLEYVCVFMNADNMLIFPPLPRNKNLTRIPDSFITDLINVYILPENADSIPTGLGRANLPSMGRTFSRTRSTVGRDPKEFHLYLAFNQITALPLKLFTLQNLTVLSIRKWCMRALLSMAHFILPGQNKLTFIPPEIVWLRNLRELNIAGNLLKYLPAEMMEMSSLTQLQAFPNPCYLKQPEDKWYSSSTSGIPSESVDKRRCISDTEHTLPKIIPLVEMAFRVLLSQSLVNPEECLLDEYYSLPLDECPSDSIYPSDIGSSKRRFPYPIPSPLREILHTCVPYSVYPEQSPPKSYAHADNPPSSVTGVGYCPSPRHRDQTGRHFKPGVFVHHAEQRITWESHITGLAVGGYVPVLWRGCQWGCLDYLDGDNRVGNSSSESPEELGGNLDHDDDDTEDIVQIFQLSGVGELDGFDSD